MAEPNQVISFNGTTTIGAFSSGNNSPAHGSVTAPAPRPSDRHAKDPSAISRALIIVVADVELAAVMYQVHAITGTGHKLRHLSDQTYFELGTISATEVLLAQVGQGTVIPDGAAAATSALVQQLKPDHLLLTGICYGLKEDDRSHPQQLGDVVVANQLRLIAHRKVSDAERNRGGEVHPSPMLIDRLRAASHGWHPAAVHFGPVLSESVLVDSAEYRERLRRLHPEAVAGEMEGSGIYTAALRGKVDWALIKGICDWGYGKTDGYQRLAADNAARFLAHTISIGSLDRVTPRV